jgi:hypothetical protein
VILEIKKKHSIGLSDRFRVGNGWKSPAFVASSTESRFIGTEPRETNHCVHLCWLLLYDLILSLPLYKFSCSQSFELAPKVIRIDWATHSKKNSLSHSVLILILILTPGEVRIQSLQFTGFAYSPPSRQLSELSKEHEACLRRQRCDLAGGRLGAQAHEYSCTATPIPILMLHLPHKTRGGT